MIIGEDSDGDAEEWDRHEALYDDVDTQVLKFISWSQELSADCFTFQGRSKERLYEEEIELKWEKGGSGLVFYTDAAYWDQLEGGSETNIAVNKFLLYQTIFS